MTDEALGYLRRQFDTAWALTEYHLAGLSTEECEWRPAPRGLHVHPLEGGGYRVDWPDHEGYDLGPASIAWLTWHLGFWWSMVLDHSFGGGVLTREQVLWPGTGEGVRAWIVELSQRWREQLDQLTGVALRSSERSRWPLAARPFGDIVAWANVELMKNAAEIGYARFLYAVRER
jgi:hypothetical protein